MFSWDIYPISGLGLNLNTSLKKHRCSEQKMCNARPDMADTLWVCSLHH